MENWIAMEKIKNLKNVTHILVQVYFDRMNSTYITIQINDVFLFIKSEPVSTDIFSVSPKSSKI